MIKPIIITYVCEGNNRSRLIDAYSLDEAAELYMEKFGSYPSRIYVKS